MFSSHKPIPYETIEDNDLEILRNNYKITKLKNALASGHLTFNITLTPTNNEKRNYGENYNPTFEQKYKQSKGFTPGHIQYKTYYTPVKLTGIKTVDDATELFGIPTEKDIRMTFANQKYENYNCDIIVDVSGKYRHYYFKYDKSIDYKPLIGKFDNLHNCFRIQNNHSDEKYDYITYRQESDNNYNNIFEVQIDRVNNEVNNIINQSDKANDALQGNLVNQQTNAAERLEVRLKKRAAATANAAKRAAAANKNNGGGNNLYEGVCIKF